MGVRGLTGLLKRYAPSSVCNVHPTQYAHKTISIDASCHLYKFVFGDDPHPYKHIVGFYMLSRYCDIHHINPIFVFDGPSRIEAKGLETAKREKIRYKVGQSLAFEKEQSDRLDKWMSVSKDIWDQLSTETTADKSKELKCTLSNITELMNNNDIMGENRLEIHNSIEQKLIPLAHDLKKALEIVEDKEKYTKTVKELTWKERDLMSALLKDTPQDVYSVLEPLMDANSAMLASLEKRSYQISLELRNECKDFLHALGYVCFTSYEHEAEAMCAHIADKGRASAVVSEDLDTIVFGNSPLLRYFFSPSRPIMMIDPITARQELNLSRESFIDMCILCGTDFSGTIHGIGPIRALQWIKKYGSIENILENLMKPYKPTDTFNYTLAREVFNTLPSIPTQSEDYQKRSVNPKEVEELLDYYHIDPQLADIVLSGTQLKHQLNDSTFPDNNPFKPSPFM